MRKVLGLVITLIVSSACFPARAADVGATLGQCLTMLLIDYGQTRDIRHRSELQESNPFMGRNPSASTVRGYFATIAIAYTAIDKLTPKPVASAATIFCVTTHGRAINKNVGLGIGWAF